VSQQQLGLFQTPEDTHPVIAQLQALDIDALTPLAALNLLADLKRSAES
jgi:hypothetical protein